MTVDTHEWAAALRSGKYTQGDMQLYKPREDTYCCLGVLADLLDPTAWVGDQWMYDDIAHTTGLYDEYVPSDLPMGVFSTMNDVWGFTFEQMADVIESPVAVEYINTEFTQ